MNFMSRQEAAETCYEGTVKPEDLSLYAIYHLPSHMALERNEEADLVYLWLPTIEERRDEILAVEFQNAVIIDVEELTPEEIQEMTGEAA